MGYGSCGSAFPIGKCSLVHAAPLPSNSGGRHRRPRQRPVGMPLMAVAGVLMAAPAGEMALTANEAPEGTSAPDAENVATAPVPDAADESQMRADQADVARTEASERLEQQRKERLREMRERRREARERAAREAREEARRRAMQRWVLPVHSFDLSAHFGESSGLWSSTHTGQDFAADEGTPVQAISSGEIISAGYDDSYGYKVEVRHWDGTVTWYCHLSQITQSSGSVMPGDQIGAVGSTGNSTGPHLHLEVRPGNGGPIDPLSFLAERGLF
jgi:murein DD-endopeptidase MepM/ murein hydrolase activator NlpD